MFFVGSSKCLAQRMITYVTDVSSKCEEIASFLRIWSHSLKKSLMQNVLCSVDNLKYLENKRLSKKKRNPQSRTKLIKTLSRKQAKLDVRKF